MKSSVIRIFFCITFLLVSLFLVFLKWPISLKTSISDILPLSESGKKIPSEIIDKYSSVINIIVEDESFSDLENKTKSLKNELSKINNISINYTGNNLINVAKAYFNQYKGNFLSQKDRKDILSNKTKNVFERSVDEISTAITPTFLKLNEDPFLLITRYVSELSSTPSKWIPQKDILWQKKGNKCFSLIQLVVNTKGTDEINKIVSAIQTVAIRLNIENYLHITGVPIHTNTMYKKTKIEITLLSILTSVLLSILTYLIFHSFKIVLKIAFNLIVGFSFGSFFLLLFSQEIHILTFVFGSSLIGICIDYSLHRYCTSNMKSTRKNILYSFLTTIFCFIPLLFSSMAILNQIALFTIGGLIGTYVWLFILPTNISCFTYLQLKRPIFNNITRKILLLFIFIISIITLPYVHFQNNLNVLYSPNEKLKTDENLFYDLNGVGESKILITHGTNLQTLLENEEKIKETASFFSLSSLLPSEKLQVENQKAIRELYKQEGKKLSKYLDSNISEYNFEKIPLTLESVWHFWGTGMIDQLLVEKNNNFWSVSQVPNNIQINSKDNIILDPKKSIELTLDNLAKETYLSLIISFISLLILMLILYKKKFCLYVVPSIFSILFTMGILSLFHVNLTFFHFISLFIVLGVSLDYTIFHFDQTNNQQITPVLCSFLSSLIGFGLLSFTSFGIISIMGITISIGITCSYLISLLLIKWDNLF